ncbi:hypothetical protein IWX50DRAFT_252874 [Phyllosticta citricarpa]
MSKHPSKAFQILFYKTFFLSIDCRCLCSLIDSATILLNNSTLHQDSMNSSTSAQHHPPASSTYTPIHDILHRQLASSIILIHQPSHAPLSNATPSKPLYPHPPTERQQAALTPRAPLSLSANYPPYLAARPIVQGCSNGQETRCSFSGPRSRSGPHRSVLRRASRSPAASFLERAADDAVGRWGRRRGEGRSSPVRRCRRRGRRPARRKRSDQDLKPERQFTQFSLLN